MVWCTTDQGTVNGLNSSKDKEASLEVIPNRRNPNYTLEALRDLNKITIFPLFTSEEKFTEILKSYSQVSSIDCRKEALMCMTENTSSI